MQRLVNHHLCIQKTHICSSAYLLLTYLPFYHLWKYFPRSFPKLPINAYSFPVSKNWAHCFLKHPRASSLIQCFTSTVSTLPFSCCPLWVMLNSNPFSFRDRWMSQVSQGSEMHFSCPGLLYQKQNPKLYLRKREAVNDLLRDLKEHEISLLLNVPFPLKQIFNMGPKEAVDLYNYKKWALLLILF